MQKRNSVSSQFTGRNSPQTLRHKKNLSAHDLFTKLSADDEWLDIKEQILPLFNGQGLQQPIEVLGKQKMIIILSNIDELFEEGIEIISKKVDSSNLLNRLIEVWSFFFGNVLPYVQAAFLPIERNAELRNLLLTKFQRKIISKRLMQIENEMDKLFGDFDSQKHAMNPIQRIYQMLGILYPTEEDDSQAMFKMIQRLKINIKKYGIDSSISTQSINA